MLDKTVFVFAVLIVVSGFSTEARSDVVKSVSNGFQIRQKVETTLNQKAAFESFVGEFKQWWNASHSYSGKAENLSIDIQQRCMLEKLPSGGFVRHLELVYYEPGKALRFTGGLGPLQEMGVSGAITFTFSTQDDKTVVAMEYNVSGRLEQGLDRFAPAIDQVLTEQLEAFRKHCETKTDE